MKTVNDSTRLTAAEAATQLWDELSRFISRRLNLMRAENDNDKDPIKTAHLRGRIAAMKELLALGSQEPAPEPAENDAD